MKYKIYKHDNEIDVVSTYAGKPVKGVSKCHPNDEFNDELGIELAMMRCDKKIEKKRMARATKKLEDAIKIAEAAVAHLERMQKYCEDSIEDYEATTAALEGMEKSLL